MRVFAPKNIKAIRVAKKPGMTQGDFERAIIIAAPNYKKQNREPLKPRANYIRNIMLGKVDISAVYVALIADVLNCSTDALYVRVRKGE